MNKFFKWSEISSQPENKRFELLSAELQASGFENEFCPTIVPPRFLIEESLKDEQTCDEFQDWLKKLKNNFAAFRLGGFFQNKLQLFSSEYPAELLKIQVADSLELKELRWWPRNYLLHAFKHFLANELKQLEFSDPVLMIGANSQSKSIIAALIKLGFTHFNITDRNFEEAKMLVEELQKSFFSTRFEKTEASFLTQLPNIYSLAICTLLIQPDEDLVGSLVYFNFLSTGAFWIDSILSENSVISNEAKSLGFQLKTAAELMAQVDFTWAEMSLHHKIDLARLCESYKVNLGQINQTIA
jgi:hypothetical protein